MAGRGLSTFNSAVAEDGCNERIEPLARRYTRGATREGLDRGDAAQQAPARFSMRIAPLLKFLLLGVLCTLLAGVVQAAARRASPPARPKANNPDPYLSLLTTYPNAPAGAVAAGRNAGDMAALIELLEANLAAQRAGAERANRLSLLAVGTFGTVGLIVILLTGWFQWRAINRLSRLSAVPALPALVPGGGPVWASRVVEQSNARLLDILERLQQRVIELEQAARAPLGEKSATAAGGPGVTRAENGTESARREISHPAELLARGQSWLNAEEPDKALACFDQILALEPRHAEALVKKGSALEKLRRLDEAIECYDRAIEADHALTIAYLHKGGLFNRLERYNEALACYEQALHTQEKGAA